MSVNNENYEPVNSNYYNYISKTKLIKNIDYYLNETAINKIEICAYEINNQGVYPFLQFLLINENEYRLRFPYILLNPYTSNNTEEIINLVKKMIFNLTVSDNYDSFSQNIEIDGFYSYNKSIFLFVDLTQNKLNINDTYLNSPVRFALIDEILNQKHICNIQIHDYVTNFFNFNEKYCILTNENNENYEIPIVSYVNREISMLNFTYIFGVSKMDKSAILGPYYYFTDFNNAVKKEENIVKNDKSGIIRFALFIKKIKYVENFPNDAIDESEIKQHRLVDENLNQSLERLTMRISDHDGNWSNTYDSCYLGNVELDNGDIYKNNIIVVKEYNQQIPLSYHFINSNNTLNEHYEIC